jgi:hypothetical protein
LQRRPLPKSTLPGVLAELFSLAPSATTRGQDGVLGNQDTDLLGLCQDQRNQFGFVEFAKRIGIRFEFALARSTPIHTAAPSRSVAQRTDRGEQLRERWTCFHLK